MELNMQLIVNSFYLHIKQSRLNMFKTMSSKRKNTVACFFFFFFRFPSSERFRIPALSSQKQWDFFEVSIILPGRHLFGGKFPWTIMKTPIFSHLLAWNNLFQIQVDEVLCSPTTLKGSCQKLNLLPSFLGINFFGEISWKWKCLTVPLREENMIMR